MLRTHLSRALLAALAVAALASGSTLVTSSVAEASSFKIDPGFGRGPERVDPGFNRDVGPKYTIKEAGGYVLHSNCFWIDRQGRHGEPGPRPSHPRQNGKVKICY